MAVRTKEELLASLRANLSDETADDSIALIEVISDTLTDAETKAKGDGINWEQKYKDNDANWRKRYTERFYNAEVEGVPEQEQTGEQEPRKLTFENLFKEGV